MRTHNSEGKGSSSRPRLPRLLPRSVVLSVFGAMIVIAGLALPPYLRAKQSAQWPSTDGVITNSWMNVRVAKGMPYYHGEIGYKYRVGSVAYHGSALSLGRPIWASKEVWQPVLDQHPMGKMVRVYYDPLDPAKAVLEPGLHGDMESAYKVDLMLLWGGIGGLVVCARFYFDRSRPDESGTAAVPR